MFCVLIPTYKPNAELLRLVDCFKDDKDVGLVIVDDGGGEDYKSIFDAMPEGVAVLHHEINRGKGAALKTGLKAILADLPDCEFVITADADGQHTHADILRMAEAAREHPEALVMGCRAFKGKVPPRSAFGNLLTRAVFASAGGVYVSDTQTGLRAFGPAAMKRFAEVPGDRYEYEINMLLDAAGKGTPIVEVPIETIYIEDNASSHFNPIKDSAKIYRCIFAHAMPQLIAFFTELILLTVIMFNGSSLFVACLIAEAVGLLVRMLICKRSFAPTSGTAVRGVGAFLLHYAALRGMTAIGLPIVLAKPVHGVLLLMRNYIGK